MPSPWEEKMTQPPYTATYWQAEQALQESEGLFRPLVENLNLVLWMKDLATDRIVYISPAYEAIWKRTRESLYESSSHLWMPFIPKIESTSLRP